MINNCIGKYSNCELNDYLNFGHFPIANFPVAKKKLSKFAKKKKIYLQKQLKISICKKCEYLQLKEKANENVLDVIYSKFYRYPSAILNQFTPSRDNFFLKKLYKTIDLNSIKNVLEIGCYDGYILNKIKQKYSKLNVFGCEPSKGADIANKFNLNVKKTFFDNSTFKNKKFDLIIIRHTLEHIYDLEKILNDIKSNMKDNSVLSIEVPNINFYLKNGLLEVFSFQHLHYFSNTSFYQIANKYNFKVSRTIETPENLIIFFTLGKNKTKVKSKIFSKNSNLFKLKLKKNINKINVIISKYKKQEYALWGAGGFAIAALKLYKIKTSSKTLFIDKDPLKSGLSFQGVNAVIKKVNYEEIKKKSLIIITSYYTSEILSEIKKIKFKGKVLQIFPKIKLIKI